MNPHRIKTTNERKGLRIRQSDDFDRFEKPRGEFGVFQHIVDCGIRVERAKPHVTLAVEIENSELGDDPLRPVAAMPKIARPAPVRRAMAQIGDKVALLH